MLSSHSSPSVRPLVVRPVAAGLLVLALSVAAAALTACSAEQKAQAQAPGPGGVPATMPAVSVTVQRATPSKIPTTIEAVGQTEGAREIEVRARVGGILQKRVYEEGAPVRAGQVLFQIDRAPFEIALAQARAALAEQRAKVQQAEREAVRLKDLIEQRAISQREYDDATSNFALAKAGLQGAEAKVREAQLNLSYTTVTAPVSGLSGRAVKSEGALCDTTTNSLLTTIVQANPIWVRFSLGDADLAKLRIVGASQDPFKQISLVLPDGKPYAGKGKLNFTANQVDTQLSTVQLRATFENPDARLLPGQFVRVQLVTGERDGVFLVPQGAVLQGDRGPFVYVVGADSKVEIRPVQTGEWQGSNWVILAGLKAGEEVILDNLLKLRPGALVKAEAAGAKPAPPAAPKA